MNEGSIMNVTMNLRMEEDEHPDDFRLSLLECLIDSGFVNGDDDPDIKIEAIP